ncbi:hypothetical protein [Pseudomonas sp. Marseille-QA0332]
MSRRILMFLFLLGALPLAPATAARSLVVTVYPHDEMRDLSDGQLREAYFQHWLDEMRSFTHHPIELVFRRDVPGITDMDYTGLGSQQILERFTEELGFRSANRPFSFLDKHLLLTRGVYDRTGLNYSAGLARYKGTTAIASLDAYSAPAHEIGHLLGATHEQAELRFNGWVCETYTHPRVPLRSNCYRYSDANRSNIVDYLRANSGA